MPDHGGDQNGHRLHAPYGRSISPSTNATNEKPKIVVPGRRRPTQSGRHSSMASCRRAGSVSRWARSTRSSSPASLPISASRASTPTMPMRWRGSSMVRANCGRENGLTATAQSPRSGVYCEGAERRRARGHFNEHTEVLGEFVENYGLCEFFELPDRDGFTPLMRAGGE